MTGGAGGQKGAGGAGEIGRRGRGVGRTKAARRRGAPAVCGRAFPGAVRAGIWPWGGGKRRLRPLPGPLGTMTALRLLYHSLAGKTILPPQIGRIPQKEGASSAAGLFCGGKRPLFWQFSQKAAICPARWRNWRYDRPFLPLCALQFRQKADCKGRLPGGTIEATSENRYPFES